MAEAKVRHLYDGSFDVGGDVFPSDKNRIFVAWSLPDRIYYGLVIGPRPAPVCPFP
jgi:hypothetical protein